MSSLAPNLFDKRFQDLMQIARALLPSLAPEWTDYNAHDPGITLVELLAWVTEAQLYSLGHMRRDERAAYAALLGVAPSGTEAARGLIWPDRSDPSSPVTTYTRTIVLPKDTVISMIGLDSPTFRPDETILWVPGSITSLVTRHSDGQTTDQTSANRRSIAFLPFGESAGRRDVLSLVFQCRDPEGLFGGKRKSAMGARLVIGVLAAPPIDGARLTYTPTQDCSSTLTVKLISDSERVVLRVLSDTTHGFLTTGALILDLDDVKNSPQAFTLEFSAPNGFARPPRLLRIEPNIIPIEQGRTITRELHKVDGTFPPDWSFTLNVPGLRFVAGQNPCTLEVEEPTGSKTWYLFSVALDLARELNTRQISNHLRKQFQEHGIILGSASVADVILPEYMWTIVDSDGSYLILSEDQRLNVYKAWRVCDRLSEHGPDENVYELDTRTGQVTFGNCVNGRIPPAGSQVLVTYPVSDGEQGNVARNRKWKVMGIEGVFGINPDPITGGAAPSGGFEERREARRRSREDHALVTAGDIEAAARALPFLEVARAWVAAPSPNALQTGVLTLVALRSRPDGVEPEQIPETARWLEAIRRGLSARMPLGTRLAVIAPHYKDFSTQAILEAQPRLDPNAVKAVVMEELGRRLTLDSREGDATPRQPGVPVTKRDIAAWLRAISGVKRVIDVRLFDASGKDAIEIKVPRNGLPRWNSEDSKFEVSRSGSGSIP